MKWVWSQNKHALLSVQLIAVTCQNYLVLLSTKKKVGINQNLLAWLFTSQYCLVWRYWFTFTFSRNLRSNQFVNDLQSRFWSVSIISPRIFSSSEIGQHFKNKTVVIRVTENVSELTLWGSFKPWYMSAKGAYNLFSFHGLGDLFSLSKGKTTLGDSGLTFIGFFDP